MHFINFLFILIASQVSADILNETTISVGSIVEPLGKMNFMKGKLVIDVNLNPLKRLIENLEDMRKC